MKEHDILDEPIVEEVRLPSIDLVWEYLRKAGGLLLISAMLWMMVVVFNVEVPIPIIVIFGFSPLFWALIYGCIACYHAVIHVMNQS